MKLRHPAPFLDSLHWQVPARQRPPAAACHWLLDQGSLTRRLQALGHFRVEPRSQQISVPGAAEARLLGLPARRRALIREVVLHVDDLPVVYARSVLPLASLKGANRVLGHMARRSLGAELFRRPAAQRVALWVAEWPASQLPLTVTAPCWGRQSLFLKRGHPLLVAEVFLPTLYQLASSAATRR